MHEFVFTMHIKPSIIGDKNKTIPRSFMLCSQEHNLSSFAQIDCNNKGVIRIYNKLYWRPVLRLPGCQMHNRVGCR